VGGGGGDSAADPAPTVPPTVPLTTDYRLRTTDHRPLSSGSIRQESLPERRWMLMMLAPSTSPS